MLLRIERSSASQNSSNVVVDRVMCLCEIKEVVPFMKKVMDKKEGVVPGQSCGVKKVKTACNELPPEF